MINIKKGLVLPVKGTPEQGVTSHKEVNSVALLGHDYPGLRASLMVGVGDQVKRGEPLFSDKHNSGVLFTSPAGGEVIAINRGERRSLLSIVIKIGDDEAVEQFAQFDQDELHGLSDHRVRDTLIQSGLWTAFRTRPFSKIPKVDATPFAIFVNAMDTNPLAADPAVVIKGQESDFTTGLGLLTRLTKGKVFLCKGYGSVIPLGNDKRVVVEEFAGPHPAGLAGTHIHHLAPADRQHTVWTINYQDVMAIGKLFITGQLPVERVIAIAGPRVKKPRLLQTRLGANIDHLCDEELVEGENRIISGSLLNGRTAVGNQGYLGRYHNQISVIEQGYQQELMGWARPGWDKFSLLNIFLSKLIPRREFALTSSLSGSHRPMVPVGSYERVFPLDMMITPLLRALIVGDMESAIDLGCLELDEEDLALCTFACPGKYDYAQFLRSMLTQIEKEG